MPPLPAAGRGGRGRTDGRTDGCRLVFNSVSLRGMLLVLVELII